LRNIFCAVGLVAAASAAFIASSAAFTSAGPSLASNVSASALPVASLSDNVRLTLSNMVGKGPNGLSSESLDAARIVAQEPFGTLYAIPGLGEVCVAIVGTVNAASCNDLDRDPAHYVSVYVPDSSHNYYVGGGVYLTGANLSGLRADGSSFSPTLVPGGFVVSDVAKNPLGRYAPRIGR
jgi:hypothetical protein